MGIEKERLGNYRHLAKDIDMIIHSQMPNSPLSPSIIRCKIPLSIEESQVKMHKVDCVQ